MAKANNEDGIYLTNHPPQGSLQLKEGNSVSQEVTSRLDGTVGRDGLPSLVLQTFAQLTLQAHVPRQLAQQEEEWGNCMQPPSLPAPPASPDTGTFPACIPAHQGLEPVSIRALSL